MYEVVKSINRALIRLTDERWIHITEEHAELAGMKLDVLETVAQPKKIVQGKMGEMLAMSQQEDGKFLVVVYREEGRDGFVITAFLTRRIKSINKRKQLWP